MTRWRHGVQGDQSHFGSGYARGGVGIVNLIRCDLWFVIEGNQRHIGQLRACGQAGFRFDSVSNVALTATGAVLRWQKPMFTGGGRLVAGSMERNVAETWPEVRLMPI